MITLASDFGSPYPAAMKGVILQATDVRLVDIAHDFPRQDVRTAAFWLREILPYFPPAVHLVVVDPGVGTDRAALAVRAGEHALVGPDNGVLAPAARALAGDEQIEAFRVAERSGDSSSDSEGDPKDGWPPAPASSTFHGRDVFAPAAARVHHTGIDAFHADAGFERVAEYETVEFSEATLGADCATGEVLVVDRFGNAITNVPGDAIAGQFGSSLMVNGERVPARETYAAVPAGKRLVTVGSHGNAELVVNRGRGDEAFGVAPGDVVRLSW